MPSRPLRHAPRASSTPLSPPAGGAGLPRRQSPPSIAVVGAGVVGLSTAVRLADALPAARVTLISSSLDFNDTTSAGAGGLWEPFRLGATDPALINRWGSETLRWLESLAVSADAGAAGVLQHSLFQFFTEHGGVAIDGAPPPPPDWASVVPSFRPLPPATVARYEAVARDTLVARARFEGGGGVSQPPRYVGGWTFDTVTAQPTRLLPYLASLAAAAGMEFRPGVTLTSLADLGGEWDAVAVCTGLGARTLLSDTTLAPVRGQVERVSASHVAAAYFVDELTYIIPNADFVVLGGSATLLPQDADVEAATRPDPSESDAIIDKTATILPSLSLAPRLGSWAGLRPVRSPVCVGLGKPLPRRAGAGAGRDTPVICCYGHGGAGVTLGWGCAGDVVREVVAAVGG